DVSPALELRVAVDEVVGEISDEKKRRRGERGHLAVFVKLNRLAADGYPARHEQAGGERIQARVDGGHEAQVEPGPSGSAADDQDVEQEGQGTQRDYGIEDIEGPIRPRVRARGGFHVRLIPRRRHDSVTQESPSQSRVQDRHQPGYAPMIEEPDVRVRHSQDLEWLHRGRAPLL